MLGLNDDIPRPRSAPISSPVTAEFVPLTLPVPSALDVPSTDGEGFEDEIVEGPEEDTPPSTELTLLVEEREEVAWCGNGAPAVMIGGEESSLSGTWK